MLRTERTCQEHLSASNPREAVRNYKALSGRASEDVLVVPTRPDGNDAAAVPQRTPDGAAGGSVNVPIALRTGQLGGENTANGVRLVQQGGTQGA